MVHRDIVEFLHFADFNDVSVDNITFQLAAQADIFYIVHYKGSRNIKLLYSAKMYDYQEGKEAQKGKAVEI